MTFLYMFRALLCSSSGGQIVLLQHLVSSLIFCYKSCMPACCVHECERSRVQLKHDGTRWHTGEEVKGKLANGVGSQYPSHYLETWCIQHYYRWCAHIGCQQSTELTPSGRFKWTRPFRTKDEIWFLRVCHHISTGLYYVDTRPIYNRKLVKIPDAVIIQSDLLKMRIIVLETCRGIQ